MLPLHKLSIDFGEAYGGPLEIKVYSESLPYVEMLAKQALRARIQVTDCTRELELLLMQEIMNGIEQSNLAKFEEGKRPGIDAWEIVGPGNNSDM